MHKLKDASRWSPAARQGLVSKRCACCWAKVAFCGRNPDRLASAHAALLNEYPAGDVFSWRCDVLNEQEVQAFANAVEAHFGGADMLINNAGQGYVAHFADTPREAWLHEAELKLFGVINPVRAFQPQLERSDIASITCVNSLLALQPEEHMIATSAARAALLNMTLTLSKDLIGKGIRVNSILLGMVESGQWQRRFANRSDKSQSWPEWTAGTGAGAAVSRFSAGFVYHRRGAGCVRRLLPSPVRKDDEKGDVNRLRRDGAGGH